MLLNFNKNISSSSQFFSFSEKLWRWFPLKSDMQYTLCRFDKNAFY